MIFPNWGAISANIINSNNKKSNEAIGSYRPTRKPTKKDLLIGFLLLFIPALIINLAFVVIMYLTN